MKKIIIWLLLSLSLLLVSCTADTTLLTTNESTLNQTISVNTTEYITTMPENDAIESISGLSDTDVIVGHYFNVLKDVSAVSTSGKDISSFMNVEGIVDFGAIGEYELIYHINYNGESLSDTRTVRVVEGDYTEPTGQRPNGINGEVQVGDGSYYTGNDWRITHPINPGYLAKDLLTNAIPTNGWWTTLLVDNYGGGNGIYTNPLRVAFSNEGMEITNPLDGFVQYWNVNGDQTIAQFPIAIKDLFLKSTNLHSGYVTEVIDYTDNTVKVAMRNIASDIDEVVVSLVQGSPYVFAETNNKEGLTLALEQGANVEFYNLEGNQIIGNTHSGDGIIIKYVQRHSGYECFPSGAVGAAEYTDKYYLVNTPENTVFSINSNVISMNLGDGNYISVAGINDLTEASYYHAHGYNLINGSVTDFSIDYKNSKVYTNYIAQTQRLRLDLDGDALQALMPHHYNNSDVLLSEYSFRTVRGTLKVMEGNYFQTELSFNGLLPGYTLPENDDFSSVDTLTYLNVLSSETELNDPDNFLNEDGPYWNSKALYPLAQGIIIANGLGDSDLEFEFIAKLRSLLSDWFTYTDATDDKYLYYNNNWGTMYYSNDDFGTASGLADHSFTHGYLIYASSVLAMYDPTFIEDYGGMVDLLLDDYMFTEKNSSSFEYLRSFDAWAGHSWAHGFGNFAEGNNLESTSEALNSWNSGYLWALATGDQERMEVAIYGFVTELASIKEYWFDYSEENWDPDFGDYVDVAGMIWGGKHDYATWFGANPTFIYGIQWLPTGEYLTNYAISDKDFAKFSSIYDTYLTAKNGEIDTWYSNMWAIQSIINPGIAISEFDANKILNDDYPAELAGTYWMINALDSLGRRTGDIWAEIQMGVSATVYETEDGSFYAMIWNASSETKNINFYRSEGLYDEVTVGAKTFIKLKLN